MARMPWTKMSNTPDHSFSGSGPFRWAVGLNTAIMASLSHCARRGPRFVLIITAFVVSILLLFNVLSSRLGAGYQSVLTWSISSYTPVDTDGLRIVVFGSQDVLGSAVDANNGRSTWTDQLCNEFNCSSLVSFVPKSDLAPGLTSNRIYGNELQGLQRLAKHTNITEKPSADYYFIAEQYPVPTDTPDLDAQIKQFLALPAPKHVPRQTLWVFTFGTWDIWGLAAMPRQSGEKVVDAMTAHIFTQVETLFGEALNPESPVFSNISANAMLEEPTQKAIPTGHASVKRSDTVESFRVVIPQLFDITLTPGWQGRPIAPMPHSKAEQMRNAAALTTRWNNQIQSLLEDWEQKGRSVPVDEPEASAVESEPSAVESEPSAVEPGPSAVESGSSAALGNAKTVPGHGQGIPHGPGLPHGPGIPHIKPRDDEDDDEDEDDDDEEEGDDGPLDGPCPRRIGLQSDPAALVLDAMTEEELRREGLRDSKGRGALSENDTLRFLDVWNPCTMGDYLDEPGLAEECDLPNDYLFYDAFTVGPRAMEEIGKVVAEGALGKLFSPA